MSKIIFLVLFCATAALGQQISFGGCPAVTVKKPFSVTSYLGKWYEAEKYPNFFQGEGKCVTATYSSNGSVVNVFNKQYNAAGAQTNITGFAILQNATAQEGKLWVTFGGNFGFPSPYWVLDTDYSSYSVVYSCLDFVFLRVEFAWILTRAPIYFTLDPAYQVLNRNGISRTPLVKTEQINCPLFN